MGLLDIFRRDGKSNEDLKEELRLLNIKNSQLVASSSKMNQDFSRVLDEKIALERKVNALEKSNAYSERNFSEDSSLYVMNFDEVEKKVLTLSEELKTLISQKSELESLNKKLISHSEKISKSRRYLATKYLKTKHLFRELFAKTNDVNALANPFRLLDPKFDISERERLIFKNFELLKQREDRLKGLEKAQEELVERERAVNAQEASLTSFDKNRSEIFEENESLKSQVTSLNQKVRHLERSLVERINSNDEYHLLKNKLDQAEIEIGNLKKGTGDEVWFLKKEIEALQKSIKDNEFQISQNEFKLNQANSSHQKKLKAIELLKSQSEKLAESRLLQLSEIRDVNAKLVDRIDIQKEEIRDLRTKIQTLFVDAKRNSQLLTSHRSAVKGKKDLQECNALDGTFSSSYILDWLTEVYEPKDFSIAGGYLASIGSGPWNSDSFMSLLLDRGYSLWELPDSDVVHLVVGREGWDEDVLLNQIDVCSGTQLRIYSQEMWMALLTTGRDPFDAEDQTLLEEFAKGHPALEFLQGLDVPWPEVSENLDHSVTEIDASDFGVSESPLHILGYKVGVTSELSVVQRRKILKDCIDHKDLTFSYDSTDEYIKKWGRPMSPQRLYRIAVHIKSMADGRVGKDPRKPQARIDWIEDLSWLKVNFAKLHAKRFVWPDIS